MGVVDFTWFSEDGRTLYGATEGVPPVAWCLAPETRDVEVVRAEVEVLSSRRIDETGAVVPASPAQREATFGGAPRRSLYTPGKVGRSGR